jgi:hypothetical protein
LVRRTTLELVGYSIEGTDEDDVFTELRGRRARRARRRGDR